MGEKKVYGFNDVGWWDNPGCSCCDSYYMEAYNAIDEALCDYGTCYSIEDCMIAVLRHEGHSHVDYEMTNDELFVMLTKHNIAIMIDGEEYKGE